MKRFIILSSIAALAILLFFASELYSQKGNERISAFNASLTYENKKEYKKAVEELTKIYQEYKNDYLINLRLGWLTYMLQDYTKSLEYYKKAVSLKKNSVEPLLGIVYPLSALKQWEDLNAAYVAVLKIDPANYTANLRLGQSYLIAQDYPSALKYLEKVKQLYPGQYEPNLSLGWTYFYLGKSSEARELFINALMLSPNDSLATQGYNLVR